MKKDKQCLSRRMLVHHTSALFLQYITQRTANIASPMFIIRARDAPSSNLWPAITPTMHALKLKQTKDQVPSCRGNNRLVRKRISNDV